MCNNIIFETDMYGHHLEYLHHLHIMASNDKDNQYYFIVPSTFQDASKKLHWEKSSNIEFSSSSPIAYIPLFNFIKSISGKYFVCI